MAMLLYVHMYLCYLLHSFFSGDFVLVYWVREGSVSVLELDKLTGDTSVGSDSQVKLGRTLHPVKIAAVGKCTCVCVFSKLSAHAH